MATRRTKPPLGGDTPEVLERDHRCTVNAKARGCGDAGCKHPYATFRRKPGMNPIRCNDNVTEKKQTMPLALATAIAVVSAIVGALFGSLASP